MTTPEAIRSIYLHVPFCRALCGYCDFYKEVFDGQRVAPLVDALLRELDAYTAMLRVHAHTIFVGGGTPTTLPVSELTRVLRAMAACAAATQPDALEFTVEANPATVTPEVAAALRDCGVNRVSIGAQSFQPGELRILERTHHPPQVRQTVETCRAAAIHNINLDLIFAIPGQTLESWRNNLDEAVALRPDHISAYALTYEQGTRMTQQLDAGRIRRCDGDLEAEMYLATIDTLAAAGYQQYEISNFALPGRECRHNLAYWRNMPYLGIGPSAAGHVAGVRYKNVPDTAQYVRAVAAGRLPRVEEESLSPERRAREAAMLALRLNEGIHRKSFAAQYECAMDELFAPAIEKHQALGLLEADENTVRLTRAGLLVADSVIADFLG